MANAFGGFLHTSPLSNLTSSTSQPPDPLAGLASNCIRDYFGPVVQTVADALHARGSSTLAELVSNVRHHCLRDWNEERGRLVDRLNGSVDGKHNKRRSKGGGDGHPTASSTDLSKLYYHGGKVKMNKARGSEATGFITNASHVRAALIVLLHHSLIKVSGGGSKNPSNKDAEIKQKPDPSSPQTHYTYTFLTEKARLLPRYPRYVEHASSTMGEHSAQIVESLVFSGRMRGEDAILDAWEVAKAKLKAEDEDSDDEDNPSADAKEDDDDDDSKNNKALKEIVSSFKKLVEGGYIVTVKPIATNQDLEDLQNQKVNHDDGIQGGEVEFDLNADGTIVGEKKDNKKKRSRPSSLSDTDDDEEIKSKKQKVSFSNNGKSTSNNSGDENDNRDDSYGSTKPHHPRILSLLSSLRKLIPKGSVFSVNASMFHTSLRAVVISRLVTEMYPDESSGKSESKGETNNMKYVGDVVNAALTYAARQEHAPLDRILGVEESEEKRHHRMAEWGTFCPSNIVSYLPAEVTKSLKSQVGGLNVNLSTLLVQMSKLNYPPIVLEVEDALGHPKGGKFEVCTRQLLQRMKARIQHQVLTTHHSLVAARIVSVLQMKGHCESDALAEDAMVPAKEAREILHRLHRDKYINLFDMHMTKTHNTGTAIFLWDVMPSRLLKTVINNLCTALLNLRLRRQHEVEVGKDWMDRAKEAGATDENVNEEDKKKYLAFCKGLERLDCACLQLDESMMVIKDF